MEIISEIVFKAFSEIEQVMSVMITEGLTQGRVKEKDLPEAEKLLTTAAQPAGCKNSLAQSKLDYFIISRVKKFIYWVGIATVGRVWSTELKNLAHNLMVSGLGPECALAKCTLGSTRGTKASTKPNYTLSI